MATELATAYVTIIPSLKGAQKAIANELNGVNTSSVGKSWGSGAASGFLPSLGSMVKIATGVLAGIGSAKILQGGISRALALEQAEMKFKALGIDVEQAMASCNEAVTGTAYGLDAAATVASSLGASGVQAGDQMTQALKGVAGMAAMSGRSMEDIGLIFGKVAAQGRLQGDELMQFAESGINATAALATYLGKTQTEVREMVTNGEIDFQTFSDAMYQCFGEAAYGANETFSGAMANVGAAINRVTAKFADPALDGLRKVFVALIPAINAVSKALDPAVEAFTRFCEVVSGRAASGIEAFTEALTNTGSFISAFKAGIAAMFEGTAIGSFISKINGFVGAVKSGVSPVVLLKAYWQEFVGFISTGASSAMETLKGIIATLPQPVQNVISKAQELLAKFQEFASSPIGAFIVDMGAKLSVFGATFGLFIAKFGAPLQTAIVGIAQVFGAVSSAAAPFGGVIAMIGTKLSTFGSAVTLCGGGVRGLVGVLGGGLRGALVGLFNPFTLVVAVIAAVVASFVSMMATSEGFRNTVMGLVASIGSSLAPVLQTVGQAIQQLATTVLPVIMGAVNSLVPILAQVVVVILQVVAAIAPVVAQIIGALMPALVNIISVVANIVAAVMPAVTAILSVVMSVISAIVPAIGNVLSVVGSVISGIISFIGMVLSVVGNIVAVVVGVASSVIGAVMTVLGVIGSVFGEIASVVTGVISTVVSVVSSGFQTAQNIVSSVANAIGSFVSGLFNTIASIFGNIVSTVSNACSQAFTAAQTAFNNIVTSVTSAVGDMMSAVSEIPGKIAGFFSDAGSWLLEAGSNIIGGLIDGITGALGGLGDALGGIGDFIVSHKGPPSYDKVMLTKNGELIMQGLMSGLENGIPSLQKTLGGVTDSIVDWSNDIEPFNDVNTSVRTWSKSEIVSSSERDYEQNKKFAKAISELGDRIENMKVVMDSGELVGATASKYDKAQGRRQLMAERGF